MTVTRRAICAIALGKPPIKSTIFGELKMRDIANGVFLGFMAFTVPLCIYVVSTGGL